MPRQADPASPRAPQAAAPASSSARCAAPGAAPPQSAQPPQPPQPAPSTPAFIAPEPDAQKAVRGSQFVLKAGDAFVVSDALGDIAGRDDGLFVDDMRVLSQWRLTFGGRAPSLLSGATSADNASFTAHLTNRPLPPLGGRETPEGVIHIERMRVLADNVLHEALTLTNYGTCDAEVPLSVSFGADFKDMFEVRGSRRERRGAVAPPCVEAGAVRLRYDGLDAVERSVRIGFEPKPDTLAVDRADYTLTIAAQACVSLYLTVEARVGAAHAGGDAFARRP
ncbi:glycogen debranching N-terminal domain-containing protein, partial [Burkholderia pseudomallei]